MKTIVKNATFAVTSNSASFVINALIVLVVPKLIGVAEYGYFQLYLLLVTYALYLHLGWCDGIYLRYVGTDYSQLNKSLLSSQFKGLILMALVMSFSLEWVIIAMFSGTERFFVFSCACFAIIFITTRIFCSVVMQMTNRMKEYSLLIIVEKVIYALALIAMLVFGVREASVLLISDLLGKICAACFGLYLCRDIVFAKTGKMKAKEFLLEAAKNFNAGFFLLISNIASIFITSLVQLITEGKYGIEAFSQIALAFNMSKFMMVAIAAVGVVLVPLLKHMGEDKLTQTYQHVRSLLMVVLSGALLLYYPIREVLLLWLPNYAESIAYLALLFPICLFEGKTQLLANAYMKALRKEKNLCAINIVSVALSATAALISIYLLNSVFLAVLMTPYILAFRCYLLEKSIQKELKVKIELSTLCEVGLASLFLVSCFCFDSVLAVSLYALTFLVYLILQRKQIKQAISYVRHSQ